MFSKTKILALASAAMLTSTMAFAEVNPAPADLSDVTVLDGYMGSVVMTEDGVVLGTVADADIDANIADVSIDLADGLDMSTADDKITVLAEQGTLAVQGRDIILLASAEEIRSQVNSTDHGDSSEVKVDLFAK
ncbi:hypothetical protein [Chachezhania sediminis]|uniref:hypothetical protein n=1 Tax=Chachezhania sediminis TaxID=2599291 RepID=UPI00131A96DF|nr:hypothetical protein [Chachezhania sediminis]